MLNLKESVEGFSNHLKFVYELEMYYGDETLKGLIDHARTLNESLEDYEEFYDLFDFPEEIEEEPEEEEVDATTT
jgi:L-arabinose isomerase